MPVAVRNGRDIETLTVPEQEMYETIDFLLSNPAEVRADLEEATEYRFTRTEPAPAREPKEDYNTFMCTLNVGTTAGADILTKEKLNPAILNFAHSYNCGGGFEHASGSQEEAVFRTSTLFLSLWPHRRADDGPNVLARGEWIGDFDEEFPRKDAFYPHSECGAIYSPCVKLAREVAKGRKAPLYAHGQLKRSPKFACISMAAQDLPREGDSSFDVDLLREKLRTIFHLAVKHGHDSIVLGAFGCGYFSNPPEEVADCFAELLFGEFQHSLRVVAFAIPDKDGDVLDEFTRLFPMITVKELPEKILQFKRRTTNLSQQEIATMMADDDAYAKKKEEEKLQAGQAQAPEGGEKRKSFEVEKKGGAAARAAPRAGAEAESCCNSCSLM